MCLSVLVKFLGVSTPGLSGLSGSSSCSSLLGDGVSL